MPKYKAEYICNGCYEVYYAKGVGEFRKCSSCDMEICIECARYYNGKFYCRDCKPVETNYYDRSVE